MDDFQNMFSFCKVYSPHVNPDEENDIHILPELKQLMDTGFENIGSLSNLQEHFQFKEIEPSPIIPFDDFEELKPIEEISNNCTCHNFNKPMQKNNFNYSFHPEHQRIREIDSEIPFADNSSPKKQQKKIITVYQSKSGCQKRQICFGRSPLEIYKEKIKNQGRLLPPIRTKFRNYFTRKRRIPKKVCVIEGCYNVASEYWNIHNIKNNYVRTKSSLSPNNMNICDRCYFSMKMLR